MLRLTATLQRSAPALRLPSCWPPLLARRARCRRRYDYRFGPPVTIEMSTTPRFLTTPKSTRHCHNQRMAMYMALTRASLVAPVMRPVVRTTAAMRPSAATPLRVRVGRVGVPVTRNVRHVAPGRARSVTVQAMADEKDQGALVADTEVAISKVPVSATPAPFVAAYPTSGPGLPSASTRPIGRLLEASNPRRRAGFRRHATDSRRSYRSGPDSWHPASAYALIW
jgi:hypothetical protein